MRSQWSNPNSARTYILSLLLLLSLLSVSAEVAARYAFPKISRIRQRIENEHMAAVHLKSEPQRPAILVVGNSLVERGVDINSLQAQLSDYKVLRFVVSDTSYFDWYFGLRRLFSEGARPRIVLLGLSARQLLNNRFEGNLSANVLIQESDIFQLARELHKDNTALTNLYFDHFSAFYGTSAQFRKWLLASELMPDLQKLGSAFSPAARPLPPSPDIASMAAVRLRAINEVCRQNGARLVLLVPPSPSPLEAQFRALEQAGFEADVDVLAPAENDEFPADLFSDGFHLNHIGEDKFTVLLASSLKRKLSDRMNANLF
jgi:hypothetical protein